MQIQINSDSNIQASEQLADEIRSVVVSALDNFSHEVTRVEVHLSDESSAHKSGQDDKRCMIEARLAGRQPTAVTHQAATIEQAVEGAAGKLTRSLQHTLGRLHDH